MIRFEGVSHTYGTRAILTDIDLDLVEPRIGIIGANGSGKSTLARMINGLVTPATGRVIVEGHDVAREGAAVRRIVSFLFSDPDAQIVMPTVGEDVAFSLRRMALSKQDRDQRVHDALARVGLADHVDHPAHMLSSGQKQLLALTAILVTEPRILVCDEPTTLLDLRNTREVVQIIDSLTQHVVMVTHDLDLVADWPRVLVIDGGRVAKDAPGPEAVAHYRALMNA